MMRKYNYKRGYRSLRSLFVVALLIIFIFSTGTVLYLKRPVKNPLPNSIKNQVSFKLIFPVSKAAKIDSNSYDYQQDSKILSYKMSFAGTNLVVSQQPAPESLGLNDQPYYPAIGIHPYAQFKTSLGTVALTKFWQSATLTPTGQSAILASQGTMLVAHSENSLTNQQWKSLFDSLKITK